MLSIRTKLGVMWWLWMHVTYYWGDCGCTIFGWYMTGVLIPIASVSTVQRFCYYLVRISTSLNLLGTVQIFYLSRGLRKMMRVGSRAKIWLGWCWGWRWVWWVWTKQKLWVLSIFCYNSFKQGLYSRIYSRVCVERWYITCGETCLLWFIFTWWGSTTEGVCSTSSARAWKEDYSPFLPLKAPSNSRTNFLHPRGNDVEWKRIDYLEAQGSSKSLLGRIWRIQSTALGWPKWASRPPLVNQNGQKFSAAAPGITLNFLVSVQDDSKIFRFNFYAFFRP